VSVKKVSTGKDFVIISYNLYKKALKTISDSNGFLNARGWLLQTFCCHDKSNNNLVYYQV